MSRNDSIAIVFPFVPRDLPSGARYGKNFTVQSAGSYESLGSLRCFAASLQSSCFNVSVIPGAILICVSYIVWTKKQFAQGLVCYTAEKGACPPSTSFLLWCTCVCLRLHIVIYELSPSFTLFSVCYSDFNTRIYFISRSTGAVVVFDKREHLLTLKLKKKSCRSAF